MPICGIPPDLIRDDEASALPMAGEANWGVAKFGVDQLRDHVKSKVKVGVIDTGIDPDHPLFSGVLQDAKDFTSSPYDFADRNGHGTHCSGTVAGINPAIGMAPGFPLYHGKGLGDNGFGSDSLIDAMEWCIEQGCVILSCSWGGGGPSASWEAAFKRFAAAKVWCVFAAGNSGPNTPDADYPGRYSHVFDVGALNSDLTPASFTSAGDKIDTSFAGVGIWSAAPGGRYAQMSGTSMATPGVAGVLALYRAGLIEAGMSIPDVYELREMAFADSTDTHTPGDDRRTGPGWISPVHLLANLTRKFKPIG